MPSFTYAAIDVSGSTVEGTQKAPTIAAARATLIDRNLYPVRIEEKRGLLQFELTSEKVDRKALLHFTRQLGVFMIAGVSITEALDIIGDESTDVALRRSIVEMAEDLRNGGTLSASMLKHPNVFPSYYVGIVRSAEMTGKLDEALESLGDYMQREIDTRSKLVSALTYPMIVLVMAIGTVVLLAGFVLPKFKPLFAEMGTELPLPTKIMLGISDFFSNYWYIAAGGILSFIIGSYWVFKTQSGRQVRDRVVLKMPMVRGLVECSLLERFCRMLGAMVSAGVPLIDGFRTTTEGTDNVVFRQKFEAVQTAMLEGSGFARPLAETKLFPGAARQMFKVGEETGTLDKQLKVAAEYFGRELEDRMRRFTAMFEPLLIIFIGGVVGFVAVALVSAMYGMMGDMNG